MKDNPSFEGEIVLISRSAITHVQNGPQRVGSREK